MSRCTLLVCVLGPGTWSRRFAFYCRVALGPGGDLSSSFFAGDLTSLNALFLIKACYPLRTVKHIQQLMRAKDKPRQTVQKPYNAPSRCPCLWDVWIGKCEINT